MILYLYELFPHAKLDDTIIIKAIQNDQYSTIKLLLNIKKYASIYIRQNLLDFINVDDIKMFNFLIKNISEIKCSHILLKKINPIKYKFYDLVIKQFPECVKK